MKKIDHRDIFLKGKNIYLKVLTKDDVLNSNWYGWFNDEELCKTLQKHYYPNTIEMQYDFWEKNILNSQTKIQLGICKIDNSKILGIVSLNNIDLINRRAEMSAVIGEQEGRGVNLFIEACKLLFSHAFFTLNLNRIYGGSISKELVTLLCRTLGCKEEGVARQDIYKNGKYNNSYLYGLLREDFENKF
jgi:RimJ/RimL family protein N-acetyltransferase